jgi:uncharacterized membrane protein
MMPFKVILGHRRLFIAAIVVAIAWAVIPSAVSTRTRLIIAWDTGVASFLLMSLHLFLTRGSQQMAALAEAQEDGQWTVFWVTFLVSVVSFFAVTTEFANLKGDTGGQRTVLVALVGGTLLLSWLLTHVVFAIRYAHEWYEANDGSGLRKGLQFPGDDDPDYMDFLYFALVLGMTFQVSDVQINSSRLRQLAMLHGLVSFLYNTIILALTVNIAAGLL